MITATIGINIVANFVSRRSISLTARRRKSASAPAA
jgi:hypothetical protein